MHISFYQHPSGKISVSLDGGLHIYLPSGKWAERDPVWVESEEEHPLTPEQDLATRQYLIEEGEREAEKQALKEIADEAIGLQRRVQHLSSKV